MSFLSGPPVRDWIVLCDWCWQTGREGTEIEISIEVAAGTTEMTRLWATGGERRMAAEAVTDEVLLCLAVFTDTGCKKNSGFF